MVSFSNELIVAFMVSCISSFILTFAIWKLSLRFFIMDLPEARKINNVPIPTMGGLAIVLSMLIGLTFSPTKHIYLFEYLIGVIIITITGILDDMINLRPSIKLVSQGLVSLILVQTGVIIEKINLPLIGVVELSTFVGAVITILWIIGVTNAINLIDGLDGLASGVSTIALISVFIMAIMDGQNFIATLTIVLIGSNVGFLFYNFHPAKIYMGDTGSLFLGYTIAVISVLGLFKKVTLFSFVIPIIILGVPIFDTIFTIIRRGISGEKLMKPDKKHFHHQLLEAGFNHRTAVLIIYFISSIFGILAIVFSKATLEMLLLISCVWIYILYIMAKFVFLNGRSKKRAVRFVRRLLQDK